MSTPGPNPQTNLILSIVFPVVAVIAIAVIFFTRPVPVAPAAPAAVNTAPGKIAGTDTPSKGVEMATALPSGGGGGASGGGMGAGMPGRGGGAPAGNGMAPSVSSAMPTGGAPRAGAPTGGPSMGAPMGGPGGK
jgi:hypothetical protein